VPEGKGKLALLVAGPPPGESPGPTGPPGKAEPGLELAARDVIGALERKEAGAFTDAMLDFIAMAQGRMGEDDEG